MTFNRVFTRFLIVAVILGSSAPSAAQNSSSCGEPTPGSGLILMRALTHPAYDQIRERLGMPRLDYTHIRALTDENSDSICAKLARLIGPWQYSRNAEVRYYSADGYFFVTSADIRIKKLDKEKRPPQVAIIQANRVIGTIKVKRN
jgi:hypothetical protein